MRKAIILSLIILLSQPLVSATDVSTNTEEDSSGTLSGNYTVKDGATWTISGDYEIADDTSIVIEDGATMIVSGSMNSTQPPQLDLAASSSVIVPVNNIAASGTMRIHFATTVIYGIGIEINNVQAFSSSEQTSENWSAIHEFDWTGTRDISASCSLPATIEYMENMVDGGWPAIMKHNHDLAMEGRRILCERLGLDEPCPEDMIACIATLELPEGGEAGIPLHEPDPLHKVLQDKYGIQVPVWSWESPKGRYIRISAQLYNHVDEYHYLADALATELNL